MFIRVAQMVKQNALHIRNVMYFLGTRAFAIVVFVLVVPFFIRQASEEQYGLAAIGFSLLTIATVLDVALGYVLIQSLGRRYARGRKLTSNAVQGLFSLYLLFATCVTLCGILTVLVLHLSTPEIIMYGSLAALLPALCVSGVVAAVYQARNLLLPINFSRIGFELGKALALAVSGFATKDISLIGPILLLTAYSRAALDIRYLARLTGIRLSFCGVSQAQRYLRLARHGIASFHIVVLTAIVTIGDKILIKNVFTDDAVAHYSVAYDINTKAYMLVNAVNTAMFAVVLHRFARKSSTFAPLAAGLITVSLVGLLYYIPLLALAPTVLTYWVSADFATTAAPLTRTMALASLFYLFGNVFENALTAMGRARQVLYIYLVSISVYGIAVALAIWQHTLIGFMYSYLCLCIFLCLGFILQYWLAKQSTITSGVLSASA